MKECSRSISILNGETVATKAWIIFVNSSMWLSFLTWQSGVLIVKLMHNSTQKLTHICDDVAGNWWCSQHCCIVQLAQGMVHSKRLCSWLIVVTVAQYTLCAHWLPDCLWNCFDAPLCCWSCQLVWKNSSVFFFSKNPKLCCQGYNQHCME